MVERVLAVLAAGLIGYALGGWLGVAVGAGSATAVSVLLEPLTPPGDRQTAHERRMRRNRRYRMRYEALEDGWRRPQGTRQRTDWKPVNRLVAEGRAVEPVLPIEIVPIPAATADAAPAPDVPRAELEAPKKAPRATTKRKAVASKSTEPTSTNAKPAATRKPRAPRATTRKPAAKPTQATAPAQP